MLLLSVCVLILFVLITEAAADGVNLRWLLSQSAIACLIIWLEVTLYTGFFVFLTEYHDAVGKLLDQFLFLPRRVQAMSLRVFAYSYAVLWIMMVAVYLFIYDFLLLEILG